jgi:hypothetical protein
MTTHDNKPKDLAVIWFKKKINPRKQPGKITIVKVEWRQIAITIQAVMRILQVRNDELKPDLSYRQY